MATAEIEQDLLMMARHGTAQHVERLVRGYRRAQEATERGREAQQWAERSVNWFHDDDGSLVLRARLPAEAGAVVLRACLAHRRFRSTVPVFVVRSRTAGGRFR